MEDCYDASSLNESKRISKITLVKLLDLETKNILGLDLKTTSKNESSLLFDPLKNIGIYYICRTTVLNLSYIICGNIETVKIHHLRKMEGVKREFSLQQARVGVNISL